MDRLTELDDWDRLARLARFHRIQGLVYNALQEAGAAVPSDVLDSLGSDARAIAVASLAAAAESQTLRSAFDAAEVPLLFLKGLTLGALAYRNPALKAAVDVDLLVDPADLGKAASLLGDCGYRLAIPKGASELPEWHQRSKESVWVKDSPPLQIDLHTRAADNARLIPAITVRSARQSVDISGGIRLPTLADDELFAYLAVHGASSAWFRLKWIADFAGFLHGRSGDQIEALYQRSQELGAGRAAGQALLVADALFGTLDRSPDLRRALGGDPQAVRLFRTALRLLFQKSVEPTERRFGTAPIHWTQFLLLPGWSYKMSELTRQAGKLRIRGR